MDKVRTREEAQNWFVNHSSGSVIAVNGNEEKEVDNYADCIKFINKD